MSSRFPQRLVLEDEDALHDDHLGGLYLDGLVGAVVDGVVVDGAVDGLPGLQPLQILHHQLRVEGVGVVVVLLAPLLEGTVLPLVVVVVMHHADVRSEPLGQMLGKGGLAGAGASGDADENGVHTRRPPAGLILSIIGNLRRKSKHSPAKVVKKA